MPAFDLVTAVAANVEWVCTVPTCHGFCLLPTAGGSEMGKRPRRCPRIGTDCWARAVGDKGMVLSVEI